MSGIHQEEHDATNAYQSLSESIEHDDPPPRGRQGDRHRRSRAPRADDDRVDALGRAHPTSKTFGCPLLYRSASAALTAASSGAS